MGIARHFCKFSPNIRRCHQRDAFRVMLFSSALSLQVMEQIRSGRLIIQRPQTMHGTIPSLFGSGMLDYSHGGVADDGAVAGRCGDGRGVGFRASHLLARSLASHSRSSARLIEPARRTPDRYQSRFQFIRPDMADLSVSAVVA